MMSFKERTDMMMTVCEFWEISGREIFFLNACVSLGLATKVSQKISEEEYEALRQKYGGVGVFTYCPTVESENGEEVLSSEELEYYKELTDAPLPEVGTRIHFQSGIIAWSSFPFKERIYRATYTGESWVWEESQPVLATSLNERVAKCLDTDYLVCDRPIGFVDQDWRII